MSKLKTRKYKKMRASTKRRSRTRRKPRKTRRSRRGGFDTPPPRIRPIEIPDAPRRVRVRARAVEEEPQQQLPVNLFGAQGDLNPALNEAYTTPVRSPNTQHNQTISPVEHVHFDIEEEDA